MRFDEEPPLVKLGWLLFPLLGVALDWILAELSYSSSIHELSFFATLDRLVVLLLL